MERMEACPGFQFVGKVGRCELGPALMWRSVCFTCSEIWKLMWVADLTDGRPQETEPRMPVQMAYAVDCLLV